MFFSVRRCMNVSISRTAAADITALPGSRIVHELLTGIALRRAATPCGAPLHAAARYPVQVP